jgi:hypothetical protein
MESGLLEPRGELTPRLARELIAAVDERVHARGVAVVSLQAINGARWSAVCELAAAFRDLRRRYDVRVLDVGPGLRSLLRVAEGI